jgi:hypothetical protein
MDRLSQLRREVVREMKRAARAERREARGPRPSLVAMLALGVALVVLPFLVLLRGTTFFYSRLDWPTWPALGGAAVLTLALVTVYAAWLSRALTGNSRIKFVARWVATPLVVAYCLHALLFLASVNAKTPDVQAYYRALHPAMRLAVSTLVIVDPGVVVTDIHRTAADYGRMELPVFEASLHYRRRDGYVHAMDLRTIDRGAIRNWLTAIGFRLAGFRTLRHVGTADHLHVSLPLR